MRATADAPKRDDAKAGRPAKNLGDFPAVAAERIHQLHRAFDELSRLVDFLDRFGTVGTRDHDAVASTDAIVRDFVAKFLAVLVKKPDHRDPRIQQGSTKRSVLSRMKKRESRSCSLADVRVT